MAKPSKNPKPEEEKPPSTCSTAPEMKRAASEARKATASATSSGRPTRRAGVRVSIAALNVRSAKMPSVLRVVMYHGATALTRMPSPPHSHAVYLVK
eukprot:CAMPEP_0206294028 /NCGR_PEP_ID=MMETSP0106_2-20121207/4441_1 /ASSEMBLY_ACC=CAM_ASM_000206 /TAXON_ID=81532 /ORGANISM="Acanthoeca-like sp., Strain 10tr" /LENGTH=96 /DNA_ID=CAMNT_0053724641 /DNA_START=221 /DNA_END=511 /DNA_ORIENTATION=+